MALGFFTRFRAVSRLRDVATSRRLAGPDFICIGAPKTGTAWLFDQLNHHPDFWMPPVKELRGLKFRAPTPQTLSTYEALVANQAKLNRQRARSKYLRPLTEKDREFLESYIKLPPGTHLSRYAKLFALKDGLKSGDITPAYSALPERIIARVARRFPDARILFHARDPVERFWSQYCMYRVRGGMEFVNNLDLIRTILDKRSTIGRSFPTDAIARWTAHYPSEQFKVCFFDDLRSNSEKMRHEIISFIGANPDAPSGRLVASFNRKASAKRVEMPPRVREYLVGHFKEELLACAELLGGPARAWPAKHGL